MADRSQNFQTAFDAGWRQRALNRDAASIRALVQFAFEPLYRFCFYRVGKDRPLCEEVVQETLVVAIGNLQQYEPQRSGGGVLPWLTGLARNEIRRALRHENRTQSLEAMWNNIDQELQAVFARIDSVAVPEEMLVREETCEMVNVTMSQLPPHYREALEAKYVEHSSVRDMAAARSMTEKAIESLLSRARQSFRQTFLTLTRSFDIDAVG